MTLDFRLGLVVCAALMLGLVWPKQVGAGDELKMTISSPAFKDGQEIPQKYTCEGDNTSPRLVFQNVPQGAKSLVLIIEDPDAPDPKKPKMVWDHWLLYNMPPQTKGLHPGEPMGDSGQPTLVPKFTLNAKNSWKKTGYGGPCPPIGRHRYFHRLYALDVVLSGLNLPDKKKLMQAMQGHIIAQAQLMGTYQKKNKKQKK